MRYRTRPVDVESVRFTGANTAELSDFLTSTPRFHATAEESWVEFEADAGQTVQVFPGDHIVRFANGAVDYCPPELFTRLFYPLQH